MKRIAIVAPIWALLILSGFKAEASWLIDPREFHISAHGQTSCMDCHEEIAQKDLHPDPHNVNKKRTDFFSQEKCLSCHDDIRDNLDQGIHGTRKVNNPKKYEYCIRCHKPHRQARIAKNRIGNFAPERPHHKQCGACHKQKTALPPLSPEDETCMTCHRRVDPDDPQRKEKIHRLCFHCHGKTGTHPQEVTARHVALIDPDKYTSVPHSEIACTACHPESAQFRHSSQRPGDCSQCHAPHDEKVAHDAHMAVACGACHLGGIQPVRDPDSQFILWKRHHEPGRTSTVHQMVRGDDDATCKRCHFKGNQVGTASAILPSKGILCMPCHTATFSIGDTITIIALIIFLAAMVVLFSYWLSGSMPGAIDKGLVSKLFRLLCTAAGHIFSARILLIIKAVILDVLLQRRLYRQSQVRWFIHSLIFWPFVFRFSWGIVALIGSFWYPEAPSVSVMLNKNHPTTAFLFDLSGMMVIFGVFLAFIRGIFHHHDQLPALPRQDRFALALIAGIVLVGFILEGMRIAITGRPSGSGYSFLGYVISLFFTDSPIWKGIYGYVWYVHAILTGAFVAYLPFSRLLHIIVAPVALAIHAVSENEHKRG